MSMLTLTRRVEASPERTFEVFTDISGAAENLSGVIRIEMLTEGEVGPGTRWKETRMMGSREWAEELTIGVFEPAHRYSVECESCGSFYDSIFDFEQDGDATVVTYTMDATPLTLFAKVMTVLMKPFMGKMMRSMQTALETDLDELKAIAEQQ